MPSTASQLIDTALSRAGRLDALGPAERLERYERGEFSMADLAVWAARYPDEPPLVNASMRGLPRGCPPEKHRTTSEVPKKGCPWAVALLSNCRSTF